MLQTLEGIACLESVYPGAQRLFSRCLHAPLIMSNLSFSVAEKEKPGFRGERGSDLGPAHQS